MAGWTDAHCVHVQLPPRVKQASVAIASLAPFILLAQLASSATSAVPMSDVAAVVVLVAAFMMICCGVLALMPDPGISVHFRMLDDDKTALHVASMHGCCDAARLLLQKGAALELRDAYGRTALHYAASENQEQLIRLLVDSGANCDAKDCQGRTPAEVIIPGAGMIVPSVCCVFAAPISEI